MEIYFDNSATTRCCPEAAEAVMAALTETYGNPSSMHHKGVEAEGIMKHAASVLAGTLKVNEKEILFTSGGTESDNLALFGAAQARCRAGRHIITSAVEHEAVLAPLRRLEKQGFEVTVLPVDGRGMVDPARLAEALREDTILVSIMYVNNETGTRMPVDELARTVHEGSRAAFHVDAVQAYGKYTIHPKKEGIDLLSVSGHKIHGPKGSGFLYCSDQVRLEPQILGGGQQGGMRSGTDNVPGAAGMAAAAAVCCSGLEEKSAYLRALKVRLWEGISSLEDVALNGMPAEEGAPQILNVSFTGVRSEVLLHALEDKGIYVSAGSACSSHKRKPSPVLTAMGLDKKRIESALRFSFCTYNTPQEVDETVKALKELVPVLRRFSRR